MATGEERNKWDGDLDDTEAMAGDDLFAISLSYPGKKDESTILQHQPPSVQTIRRGDGDNRLYYGDNLDVLAHLAQDSSVCSQVRLIYIDPPFATNKVFKSRARKDAYHDLRSGADYLEFIRERLVFLRELLADDGSIYVHLDSNMAFYVKTLMDEVFGRDNMRNVITRRKCNPKNYTRNQYSNIADYILFYAKSTNYVWNRAYQDWTPERIASEYQYVEEETGRRYKKVPVHAPGERNGATGQPWRDRHPPPGKHWQYPPSVLDEMDARGEIYWSPTGNPRRKIYLDQSPGVPVQDIWLDVRDAHNQNIKITGYPTEKPPALLRRIINASSNAGDLVLDCFAGSGTTLAVASELDRRWIGVDSSLEAIKTTLHRFASGTEPMGDFVNPKSPAKQAALPLFETTITDFELLACGRDLNGLS